MAECAITGSIDLSCDAKRQVGGVKTKVWRVSAQRGFTYTTDGTGYLTALAFAQYQGLVTLEGVQNSHSGGAVPQRLEGGNLFYQHDVLVKTLPENPTDDEVIEDWASGEGAIILETNNKEFFLFGADNGMQQQSDGGFNTGQTRNSDVATTLNMQGGEKKVPLRILDTDYATTLALLESYEI